jgi:hypothetical protein
VKRLNSYNDSPSSIFTIIQSVKENRVRHYRDLKRGLERLKIAFDKELDNIKFKRG